jgi:hypothetical protein
MDEFVPLPRWSAGIRGNTKAGEDCSPSGGGCTRGIPQHFRSGVGIIPNRIRLSLILKNNSLLQSKKIRINKNVTDAILISVADPGCLYRIPASQSFLLEYWIQGQKKNIRIRSAPKKVFLTQKKLSKLLRI